jgi:hypothetical protein
MISAEDVIAAMARVRPVLGPAASFSEDEALLMNAFFESANAGLDMRGIVDDEARGAVIGSTISAVVLLWRAVMYCLGSQGIPEYALDITARDIQETTKDPRALTEVMLTLIRDRSGLLESFGGMYQKVIAAARSGELPVSEDDVEKVMPGICALVMKEAVRRKARRT